jgi:hypothetical protein
MNSAPQSSWTPRERLQVFLVGVAPTFAITLFGLAAATVFGQEAIFLAFFALPLEYGTLFLSVFPTLAAAVAALVVWLLGFRGQHASNLTRCG